MKKLILSLVSLFLFVLSLVGCNNSTIKNTTNGNNQTEGVKTTLNNVTTKSKKESEVVTTTVEVSKPALGSEEQPLTVGEAIGYIFSNLNAMEYTTEKAYVVGVVSTVEYNSSYKSYTVNIKTSATSSSLLQVYSGTIEDKTTSSIHVGDEILVYGYLYKYNESPEITGSTEKSGTKRDYPQILKITHQERTLTLGDHENATVEGLSEKAMCGSKVEFSVSVSEGYEIYSVKVNGKRITGNQGSYSFYVDEDSVVTVEAIVQGSVVEIGSLDEPLSVTDAIEKMDQQGENVYSDSKAYVEGKVKSVTYNETHKSYTCIVVDTEDESKTMQFYSSTLDTDVTKPHVGDTVIAYGYINLYVSESGYTRSYEVSGSEELDYPVLKAVEHQTRTITLTSKNAVVEGLNETVACGTLVQFSVSPEEGYRIFKVSVNGVVVTEKEGFYSFEVEADSTVKVSTLGVDDPDPTPVTVTKTVAELATANQWQGKDAKGNAQVYASAVVDSVVTIEVGPTSTKGNTGKYYPATNSADATWRLYSTEGAYIVITVPEGYELVSFSYTRSGKDDGGLKGYDKDVTYKISGNTIKIETSAKCFLSGFTVSYIESID